MPNPSSDLHPNLYPAIRDALLKALDSATPGPCELCGKVPAQPYAIAYARMLSSSGVHSVTTAFYGPVASKAVNVCDSCVQGHKRRALSAERRKMFGLIVAAALLIASVLVAMGIVPLDWRWIVLALVGCLGFLALVASSRRSELAKNPRLAGSQVALSIYEEELKREGFTTWQDEDLYRSVP